MLTLNDYVRFLIARVKFPLLTTLLSLICIAVFWAQYSNHKQQQQKLAKFCQHEAYIYSKFFSQTQLPALYADCTIVLYKIHKSINKPQTIVELALTKARSGVNQQRMINALTKLYGRFLQTKPPDDLTSYLMYRSESWNPWHMLTAVFAHMNFSHLSLNLIYFLLFATFVEWMIGAKRYLLSFFVLVFGSQIAYSIVFYMLGTAAPTIGLSGVATGMIGIAVVIFYAFKPSYIPDKVLLALWLIVILYLLFNLYGMIPKQLESGINFVAHSTGAILGLIIGLLNYQRVRTLIASELQPESGQADSNALSDKLD